MKQLKKYLKLKLGVSTGFDIVAENSRGDKDVAKCQKKTFVLLSCRKKQLKRLIGLSPTLKLMYPSFKKARHVVRKAHKPPKGKRLIQLTFADKFIDWAEGRVLHLIKRVAKLTGISEDSIDLVEVKEGSLILVLRVPEGAAEAIASKSTEGGLEVEFQTEALKDEFPTLKAIEPTEEAVDSIEDLVEQIEDSTMPMRKCTDVLCASDQLNRPTLLTCPSIAHLSLPLVSSRDTSAPLILGNALELVLSQSFCA